MTRPLWRTPREAAQDADALLLAVHWSRVDDVLKQAGDLAGTVIATCSLPLNAANSELVVANGSITTSHRSFESASSTWLVSGPMLVAVMPERRSPCIFPLSAWS